MVHAAARGAKLALPAGVRLSLEPAPAIATALELPLLPDCLGELGPDGTDEAVRNVPEFEALTGSVPDEGGKGVLLNERVQYVGECLPTGQSTRRRCRSIADDDTFAVGLVFADAPACESTAR